MSTGAEQQKPRRLLAGVGAKRPSEGDRVVKRDVKRQGGGGTRGGALEAT